MKFALLAVRTFENLCFLVVGVVLDGWMDG